MYMEKICMENKKPLLCICLPPREVPYDYGAYTDEELLKKFKLELLGVDNGQPFFLCLQCGHILWA